MKHFRTLILLAVIFCLLAFPLLLGDQTTVPIAVEVLLVAGAATSWNLFSGYTGYISLGNATYYGIGAYVLALLCQDWHIPGGYGPFLLLPLAGLVASAFAVPLGWIALRTRRFTFIVITIAIFFLFQSLAYNLQGLTGGSGGIYLPIPDWGADLFNLPFYYVASALVVLVTLISWWIRHSKFGLGLLAIRDDEDRVRGLGVATGWYTLGAYVLSAFCTGVVGATAIYFVGSITPSAAFDQGFDLTLVTVTFLGGIGTVFGPIVGSLLIVPFQTFLVQQFGALASGMNQILFGCFLLAVILLLPEGIVPLLRKHWPTWHIVRTSRKQAQVMDTQPRSFPALAMPATVHVDVVLANEQDMHGQVVSAFQLPYADRQGISPILDERSVIRYPLTSASPRVKAYRLVPLLPQESTIPQEPAAAPPIVSWRCPYCHRPFLLRGDTCYCPRCGFTRLLAPKEHPFLSR